MNVIYNNTLPKLIMIQCLDLYSEVRKVLYNEIVKHLLYLQVRSINTTNRVGVAIYKAHTNLELMHFCDNQFLNNAHYSSPVLGLIFFKLNLGLYAGLGFSSASSLPRKSKSLS